SSLPVVEATPAAQPPPTIEATSEPVEEAAAAPEDGDTGSSAVAPDVYSASSEPAPQPPPPPVDPATLEAAVVAGINAQRAAAGLPSLQLDPDLAMVARERSNDMAQRGYFGHVSPTGETISSLMQSHGVAYSWCGENIAYNNFGDDQTVAVVLSAWMASPGHRDNVLRSTFSRVGVGVALGGSGVKYYTAVFAGP
ncbi:MAG TPA: CAP domain-containing protein, partial [Dehalococcoidia bacterium]|nr:CAP domain-containing protein [Dehalococcoidia bacterium]